MRKLSIAALTALAVLAAAGTALAVNQYDLTNGSTGPRGKGSSSKPVPKRVSFDFTVKDSAGPRGAPVRKYRIGFQGLTTKYADRFPRCRFGQTDNDEPLAAVLRRCRRAKIGEGRIESLVTLDENADDPNDVFAYCNLELTLFNVVGGISIRVDADNTTQPSSQDGPFGCLVNTHRAIKGKFTTRRIAGVPSSSLDFTVPLELRHNAGFTLTIARAQSDVVRKVKRVRIKGKRRKVGIFSAIGCGKRNKRIVRVTFEDENGVSSDESSSGRC